MKRTAGDFAHKGIPINIDSEGQFVAELGGELVKAPTLAAAKRAIDKATEMQKEPLRLPVIISIEDDTDRWAKVKEPGRVFETFVVGVNRTNRQPMFDPKPPEGFIWAGDILADTQGNREHLKRVLEHEQEGERLKAISEARSVSGYRNWGGRISDPKEYASCIERLKKAHEKSTAGGVVEEGGSK